MTIRKDRAAALKLDRNEQEIVLFDEEGVTSFPWGMDEGTDLARSRR
jgi:predicted secreted protein